MTKRPSAWDVSFPDEAAAGTSATLAPSQAPDGAPRRPSGRSGTSRSGSRGSAEPPVLSDHFRTERAYVPTPEDIKEDVNTVVFGEDAVEQSGASVEKPIRALSDFVVFDPTRGFEHITLDVLDDNATPGRHFEAAGHVRPIFLNEEDEGQEDGLDDGDGGEQARQVQRIRTSAVFRWYLDYTKVDDPLYIETQYSWFELRAPAHSYQRIHQRFYRPNRIAQILVSTAIQSPAMPLDEFAEANYGEWDAMLGEYIFSEDIQETMPFVRTVIDGCEPDVRRRVLDAQFIADLLRRQSTPHVPTSVPRPRVPPPQYVNLTSLTGNLDLLVLRPEKQNPTHVSALIDVLALGLFHEHLKVVGPPPKHPSKRALKLQQAKMRLALTELANRCIDDNTTINFPHNRRLHEKYWSAVIVDGVTYEIGECVVVQANTYRKRPPRDLPDDLTELPATAIIADYFWFAKIIYIDQHKRTLHVQWYEHSSKTYLDEISDPHEVFLWPTCDDIDARIVVGKATIHRAPPADRDFGALEYFCRFAYHEEDGSFQDIDDRTIALLQTVHPPENCATCHFQEQQTEESACVVEGGALHYGGHVYHVDDYALYAASGGGPACVGRIAEIHPPRPARSSTSPKIRVARLGRRSDVGYFPNKMVHERELFLTGPTETIELDAKALLKPCVVVHRSDVLDLEAWFDISPFNFYAHYRLPTLSSPWAQREVLRRTDVLACDICLEQHNERFQLLSELSSGGQVCLRTFDPFGGVGAFGLAMEELGCMKLTHAVEITPSAALTLRKNSPETVVFNQCSNLVFQYAVKYHAGNLSSSDMVRDLHDNTPIGKPPCPGDIDCIVAGFPCQPHSQLNMFKKANDRKTNLILNLLSWVDFLRPKYCFFENVRGFLSSTLHARQASKYRVEGGIKMGGLKFLTRSLLAMGYQVRFGLLQAGHYGTPQARVRFFLVAAQIGYPLPKLPQPTHDFPLQDGLEIKFSPDLPPIRPILTANGTAPFKFVSTKEAIEDLPVFDWRDPHKIMRSSGTSHTREGVLTLECDVEQQPRGCGLTGPCPSRSLSYRFDKPRNSFQARCRSRPTRDLQHITRVTPACTRTDIYLNRVVNIPLRAGADYRELNARLWEWQSAHPTSAMARDGFRPGMYGRLDEDKWFHTTVTNVSPTAKQSRVIHPTSKRILTVRELARSQGFPDWFVFHAVDGNVKTLQRHIGNAVPWPVSVALARELREALLKKRIQDLQEAIRID
ncbi:S-adenosyl-L-methionine-dependent methyltransferase [Trametes versicolor FP-101664 SS1]|uniref:S-adenosyl-L-methionine-dependent methyltransferase n=1 Tax=Trametes versicolor (strain FP-101664) TaxID=717944 RepID=UPI0004621668|nr:S-adenosyl-L-methionine-dependent methyltransferase [Trametes versicolor FP-101664 SS1]EIW64172.1 S-adenosyl-L-methionine-dependent methyltransferase [Trametes versicolor FP-101664 SS1]